MRASQQHMAKIRSQILEAAGKGFREKGYGGLGINGLAKRANLTSGAFYGHFSSKNEAFQEVVKQGLTNYATAIAEFEKEYGDDWIEQFLDYYLGRDHVDNIADSCVIPGLSADVMRADDQTKKVYSTSVKSIAKDLAEGLKKSDSSDAMAAMALLGGAVMMARCMDDSKIANELLRASKYWVEQILE